ncbi:hypothetical protein [Rhizobium tubonense]|uniref:hypothetical protein n=1 Tax=Rhizobium tubonense TaxID=484088 RepID=UPI0011B6D4AC|nr:hypothetical protein [Rhizobium tubonense]
MAIFLLIDWVARPLYRPVVAWITSWRVTEAFEVLVGRLPRWAVLVLFAVPFAIAEPLKIISLIIIAQGHVVSGIGLLVFAHLMTFVLVERIYHAGRAQLLSYRWFNWIVTHVAVIRDVLLVFRDSVSANLRRLFRA